jgi:hypothetical protein
LAGENIFLRTFPPFWQTLKNPTAERLAAHTLD